MGSPRCVAITGLDTYLGESLAERLLARGEPPRIVGLDLERPLRLAGRVGFHRVDLTEPVADARIAQILQDEGVEVVVHLAFEQSPKPDLEASHDLEAVGTHHLLNAVAAAGVPRLVVQSSTMVYGPAPDNPNYLPEDAPLRGHPEAHSVENRREVEEMVAAFAKQHGADRVCVLRHCWVMGPTYRDHVVQYFDNQVVPVVLGFDPLIQLIHEDDLLDAFEHAALGDASGAFNVVGQGVLPLSMLIALAGKRRLQLPPRLLYRLADYPSRGMRGDGPSGFFDYLRYLWVADGRRAWEEFGLPGYTTREAWISFTGAARMRQYA
jgi:UDP-glucose 4-epimerase